MKTKMLSPDSLATQTAEQELARSLTSPTREESIKDLHSIPGMKKFKSWEEAAAYREIEMQSLTLKKHHQSWLANLSGRRKAVEARKRRAAERDARRAAKAALKAKKPEGSACE